MLCRRDTLQGSVEISADDRWLAFIASRTPLVPSPNYHLVDLKNPEELEPIKLPASGLHPGLSWVSFGAGLLATSGTSLHSVPLLSGETAGEWFPKAWVAQGPSAAACTGTSSRSLRKCSQAKELERARRAFLPPGAMLEAVQVDVHARYVASNDGKLLVAWDTYGNRPIILDTTRFPPREISPSRPDGSNLAELYEFRQGTPRDNGPHVAPGLLRFSHFGLHLVTLAQERDSNFSASVQIGSYSIPDLKHRPELNPSLPDYLRARRASPALRDLALCRLEPEVCLKDKMHPHRDAILAEVSRPAAESTISDLIIMDESPGPIAPWMRRDPARIRARAPELCNALVRIQRPIQGEPFFVNDRYEGIRIDGQSAFVASDQTIPFREGDILFDGGWCANRTCSADEFSLELKRICTSRGGDLIRAFVLEVGSAEPSRNRSWVMLEKP